MDRIIKYFKMLKPYLGLEYLVIILSFMSSAVALINPILLQVIIDKILILSQIYLIKYVFFMFLAFYGISCIISYSSRYISTYIGQDLLKGLRIKIFRHMQNIELSEKIEIKSGDFIAKINDDTATVASYISNTFVNMISSVTNVLATGMLMLMFSKTLSMIMFATTIIEIIISFKFTGVIKENDRAIKMVHSQNINFLNQFFSGFKYMKAYRKEQDTGEKYTNLIDKSITLSFKSFYISFTYEMLLSFIAFAGSLSVYGLGIYLIYQGNMTVGTLFVFDIIAERFNTFASALVNFNVEIQSVLVSIDRLESLTMLQTEGDADSDFNKDQKSIERSNKYEVFFENVVFSYKDVPVIRGFTYQFESGKSYAIVGDSGSGKSSLVNLMLKFYVPQEGSIYINGQALGTIPVSAIRTDLIAVFQDAVLNDETIEENIRYGNHEATQKEVEHVCRLCCIHDFIVSLPHGYQSSIGEIGEKISGGQKQRICIARALLRNAKGYIFDEAFCSLDKSLESQIYLNIEKEFKNRILIIISHNIQLMSQFANIIVLKDGRIEAVGDHETLMEKSATYMELYSRGGNTRE